MESRLMLSGNQIDYSIWNLDSIQNNYAVISQGGTLPAVNSPVLNSNDSVSDSDSETLNGQVGGQLDVGWVQVPGLFLNRQQALTLAQRHLQDAVAQGVVSFELNAQLADQWSTAFAFEGSATRIPVFAIGFGSQLSGLNGGLVEYDLDSPSGDVLSPTSGFPALPYFNDQLTLGSTNALSSSLSEFKLHNTGAGLSTSFSFSAIRLEDSIGFFRSIDVVPGLLGGAVLSDARDIFADFQSTLDVALNDALSNPVVDVRLSDDVTEIGSPATVTPKVFESVVIPAVNQSSISTATNSIAMGPAAPVSIIQIGAQIVGQIVEQLHTPSTNDLSATVERLLAEDAILAENAEEAVAENAAGGDGSQLAAAGGESLGRNSDSESAAAPETNLLAEGGMVPVESIVGAVASGGLEIAPTGEQLAGTGDGAELIGDLARVAVMELIEGAEEPMAPVLEGDHVAVLAAHDAAGSVQLAKVARGDTTGDRSIVQTFAEQAGSAVALVMPVSPSYLAALVTSVSDVFAAVAFGDSSSAAGEAAIFGSAGDATRDEAFADWDGLVDDSPTSKEDDGFSYLSTLPLVGALAIERLMAAKRRRQQAAEEQNSRRQSRLPR
jgi:hypothetical protein